MSTLSICFVTREYAHEKMGKTGGIGVFLKCYVKELCHHGFEVYIFSFGTETVKFIDDGVIVHKIKDLSNFNEGLKTFLRKLNMPGYITIKMVLETINRLYISLYLSVLAFRKRFDLIEFHDYGGDAAFYIGNQPQIVRCHGSAWALHRFMGYIRRKTDDVFEKLFFRRFHKNVIGVSKYSSEITQKAFGLKKLPTVIYNSVSVESEVNSFYFDPPTIRFSIYYFGSIRERKGIDIACKAFNNCIETFPDATFHVLGNNNNDHWNKVAVPILNEKAYINTTYYGAIPHHQINDHLKKAHVVLFPSFGENFSIALLEVMALGKIAITSNIPAFEEIIRHEYNGFIANDESDYFLNIKSIFEEKINLETISHNAIATIKNEFDSSKIIEQNIRYYKSLL